MMTEIAESSFDPESYRQIMGVIARRLKEEVCVRGVQASQRGLEGVACLS